MDSEKPTWLRPWWVLRVDPFVLASSASTHSSAHPCQATATAATTAAAAAGANENHRAEHRMASLYLYRGWRQTPAWKQLAPLAAFFKVRPCSNDVNRSVDIVAAGTY